jgi:1-acyl-sn-glycerol-3-phosphate acyltransferase
MGARLKLGDILYSLIRALAWVLTHLVCRYHVSGREHVPPNGALLVVANHLSWYDPFLLAAVLPRRLWFYTKAEIFTWPIAGWLARETGQIPVHRGAADRAALEQALTYLRAGKALVIFPEGTVERQEHMIAAHSGVAMLAVRSGATVLPVAHSGTRRVLRSRSWQRPRVTVCIGTPYVPSLPEGTTRKAGLQLITQQIMEQIAEMLPPEQRGTYT